MNTQITTQLTAAETDRLQALETIVGEGSDTFVRVGAALAEICDSKLYRESFSTFNEYCEVRWHFTANYARRLIDASGVVKQLESESKSVPIGTISRIPNEATARELAKAPPEERAAVVEAAQAAGRVTAKAIKAEVEKRKPAPAAKSEPAVDPSPAGNSEPDPEPAHTESADAQIEIEISMLANAFFNGVKKYRCKAIGLVWWEKTLERINQI